MSEGADETSEKSRRTTVASSYLEQAVGELRNSGSSDALFPVHKRPAADATRRMQANYVALGEASARSNRVLHSRSAVLYAILAAEAYANQYLQWHLSNEEFSAADKLPTFDKFVLGPRLVRGASLLERGAEPAQTLHKLLRLRSRLVHPKLPTGDPPPVGGLFDDPAEFAEFNPQAASRYIVAVADAAGWLLTNSDPPSFDLTAAAVDQQRDIFLERGRRASEALPSPSDAPIGDLLLQAFMAAKGT